MPELPEVEVLVRHLAPLLQGLRIRGVTVSRPKVIRPHTVEDFSRALVGAQFSGLRRRGKYLVFTLRRPGSRNAFPLVGHLGMSGRMYLCLASAAVPRHCAVALGLGHRRFVFEDPRYFGRLTLDARVLDGLGPEPLEDTLTPATLAAALRGSRQALKVRLLDQTVLAGLGNIYASEALFRARLSPRRAAGSLQTNEVRRLHAAIRAVLTEAIRFGSTVPLDWAGAAGGDRLFYYGRAATAPDSYVERLAVYDRAGAPCQRCGTRVRRLVQAGRSTFYCPRCQRS